MSKAMTVGQLKQKVCEQMRLDFAATKVYNYVFPRKTDEMKDLDRTMSEASIIPNQKILFDDGPSSQTTFGSYTNYSVFRQPSLSYSSNFAAVNGTAYDSSSYSSDNGSKSYGNSSSIPHSSYYSTTSSTHGREKPKGVTG